MEHRKTRPQQAQNSAVDNTERRYSGGVELRNAAGGRPKLFGYALRFGSIYDMGWFTEEISREALQNADMSDVRILQDHVSSLILGRTSAGTARVGVDNTGMWYEVDLPDSPNGENVRVAVERGDITQSSWGFRIRQDETGRRIGDKWEMRDGKEHRIIFDVSEVFDASPVTYPANPDTTVAKRSRDMAFAGKPLNLTSSATDVTGVLTVTTGSNTTGTMVLNRALPSGWKVFDGHGNEVLFSENRDGGEGEGEDMTPVIPDTTVTPGEPLSTWEIGYLIDRVASVTEHANRLISYLNGWKAEYAYFLNDQTNAGPLLQSLIDECDRAKASCVSLINVHADAIKELNTSENRAESPASEEHTKTNTTDSTEIDLAIEEARIRSNNLFYHGFSS